ncbi:hypothetical protein BDU57DRAFT_527800 [Ampelomyces quisqualis]|uniref:Uncharacterized protein n=1 Tax=Ampelomyces quisqualis TaxID=50730 RepID=A0A6A5QYE8_AMPQU|nr:hypothetical protein BDU57DRAFT_527800 [Ampelomyces quisqualis]
MGASHKANLPSLPIRGAISASSSAQHMITKPTDDTPARHGLAGAQPEVQLFTLPPPRRASTLSESSDNSLPEFEPAAYFEEGAANTYLAQFVGTAAYYKSRKFRNKEADGRAQVPGLEDYPAVSSECVAEKPTVSGPLVMIFGKTNVRRASLQRKFEIRLQRTNRRMKRLRKLYGTESMFGWD